MKKILMTAILYTDRNYDLSYRLHLMCKKNGINLIDVLDFVELTIKSVELRPNIIFCDCQTVHLTSASINAFLEKSEFKNTSIIFVGDDDDMMSLKNIVCRNLKFVKLTELEKTIEDLRADIDYEKILENRYHSYNGLDEDIYALLNSLGLSPKHVGYAFVKCCIKNVVLSNCVMYSLTEDQYPVVASIFKTTSMNVERNIRNAIGLAWDRFGRENWSSMFYLKSLTLGRKPTNREFIFMCSQRILSQCRNKLMTEAING